VVLIVVAQVLGLLSRVLPERAAWLAMWLTRRPTRRRGRHFGRELARHRIDGGEVVLRQADAKGRADGARVLLVHGWNADAADWLPLAQPLADAGLQVFAADLPGHGSARGRTASLPRFVRALAALDRAHGPFDIWIGHSMGANAALAVLAAGARAQRVVLLGTLVDPAAALRGFARDFGLSSEAAQAYLRQIESSERMRLDDLNAGRNAARIHQPTLLVHDTGDRVIPIAHGESLAVALPDARLLRTEGLGHRRLLADAAVAAAVVSFSLAAE
jgi:pimeloyl-ACP methyl ester carboxylesterase